MESETAHKAKLQDVLQTSILLRDSICSVRHEQKNNNCRPRAEITSQSLEHGLYQRLEITLLTIQHSKNPTLAERIHSDCVQCPSDTHSYSVTRMFSVSCLVVPSGRVTTSVDNLPGQFS